jgi:hypothetical protein
MSAPPPRPSSRPASDASSTAEPSATPCPISAPTSPRATPTTRLPAAPSDGVFGSVAALSPQQLSEQITGLRRHLPTAGHKLRGQACSAEPLGSGAPHDDGQDQQIRSATGKDRTLRGEPGSTTPTKALSGVEVVVFDVGETLVDESRSWSEWADWRMGRYGAMDCVGPRPGTPPPESDSRSPCGTPPSRRRTTVVPTGVRLKGQPWCYIPTAVPFGTMP